MYDLSYQGSRVPTLSLSDGTSIEFGISIIYEGNTLIMEMIRNDPTLQVGEPHVPKNETWKKNNTTSNYTEHSNMSWEIFNDFQGSLPFKNNFYYFGVMIHPQLTVQISR